MLLKKPLVDGCLEIPACWRSDSLNRAGRMRMRRMSLRRSRNAGRRIRSRLGSGVPIPKFAIRRVRLASRSHVLPQLRPGRQTGAANDLQKLSPQVDRFPTGLGLPGHAAMLRDDMHSAGFCLVPSVFEVRLQLGEHRDDSLRLADVMLGLGTWHERRSPPPINVLPLQRERLARNPKPTESSERHKQPPFGIRASVDELLSLLAADESLPVFVSRLRQK